MDYFEEFFFFFLYSAEYLKLRKSNKLRILVDLIGILTDFDFAEEYTNDFDFFSGE